MAARTPFRILAIGAGPAAVALHFPALAALRDAEAIELSCICDLQNARTAAVQQRFKFREATGDATSALQRDDIDVVYVFGSAQLHYELGLQALRAGKHLFVEKPIAPSYAQACEMAEAAAVQRVVATGGHNRRFYQSLAALRARAGAAGWRFAEATFHKPEFGKPPLFGAHSWLSANGIHALDALLFMMGGLPEHLSANAVAERGDAAPSAFSAVMRWPGGAQAVFLCNNNAGARREEYVFHAAGETCRVSDDGLIVEKAGAVSKSPFPSLNDGITAEHEQFMAAIREGTEPPHSIAKLAPSLLLAELIEAGHNGRVMVPERARPATPLRRQEGSILVVEAAALLPAIGRLLPGRRLVSLDDIHPASVRDDVVACLLGRGARSLPDEVLDKLPRLRIVGAMGLSVAHLAPQKLLARDILLVNASAAYAETVAEFALGLAILGRRRAFISHEVMRQHGWGTNRTSALRRLYARWRPALDRAGLDKVVRAVWGKAKPLVGVAPTSPSRDLNGASVGLIGWSANARAFARRLVACGARVLVFSDHALSSDILSGGAVPASLGEVLSADIVSLHRGLTKQTRHFLGAAELARLRPGAVLLNVARGALIEPKALLARLRQGDIFACLDTFEEEPLPASHPLRQLPNVFLTSHIAGGSGDMHAEAAAEVVGKIAAFLDGENAEPITAERLRTMT